MPDQGFEIGGHPIGNGRPFFVIAGPCVIENAAHCLLMARSLRAITAELGLAYVFKASFDKANRTSATSFRGPGLTEGLDILRRVREEVGVPVLSDVHEVSQVGPAATVLDVIQIPAFLCRQTDLVTAAAKTGRWVNIKKGQFLAPEDMRHVVGKVTAAGSRQLMLTERGASFGYHNLVVDFRSLPTMRELGFPVIFDATHSVQLPAGAGDRSGGQAQFIEPLARAAVAVGVDGLFFEVHDRPEAALSDGPNSIRLDQFRGLLTRLVDLDRLTKELT